MDSLFKMCNHISFFFHLLPENYFNVSWELVGWNKEDRKNVWPTHLDKLGSKYFVCTETYMNKNIDLNKFNVREKPLMLYTNYNESAF